MYYDFWIEEIDEKMLKKLGFDSFCIVSDFKSMNDYKEAKKGNLELCGVRLSAKNWKELRKKLNEFREADLIILDSYNPKLVEMAIKTNSVDAVTFHVKYPFSKKMAERKIAQIINFNDLLNASEERVPSVLKHMEQSVKMSKKYGVPLMIVSGAKNKMEYRAASDLIGFGEMLGLTGKEAKESLFKHQKTLSERARLRKENKWIRPGVVIEDGS